MTTSTTPTRGQLKTMATRLRTELARQGVTLSHGQALELVSRQLGHRDWNTAAAVAATAADPSAGPDPRHEGTELGAAVPVLRIFDQDRAREFYQDFLDFTLDWEHRFGEHMPLYAQVSRGGAVLHLSEHHGDASPGGAVLIRVADVDALHDELAARNYRGARPGVQVESWGRTLTVPDPFNNRLTFHQPHDESLAGRPTDAAAAIEVRIEVAATPDVAFDVFTRRMGRWWDPAYTPDAATYTGIAVEPRVGGEVAMLHGDKRHRWGTVTAWQPGVRFAQTFTLAHDPEHPSRLTVDFEPLPSGCLVLFSHGGWTAGNVAARQRFQDWPHLLGRFAELAENST